MYPPTERGWQELGVPSCSFNIIALAAHAAQFPYYLQYFVPVSASSSSFVPKPQPTQNIARLLLKLSTPYRDVFPLLSSSHSINREIAYVMEFFHKHTISNCMCASPLFQTFEIYVLEADARPNGLDESIMCTFRLP